MLERIVGIFYRKFMFNVKLFFISIAFFGIVHLLDMISTQIGVMKYGIDNEQNVILKIFFQSFGVSDGFLILLLLISPLLAVLVLAGFKYKNFLFWYLFLFIKALFLFIKASTLLTG